MGLQLDTSPICTTFSFPNYLTAAIALTDIRPGRMFNQLYFV
jgi:hypothetical protein